MAESLEKSLDGVAGLWPAVLPGLRERARLKRAELVARLADALGVSGGEKKVADYYHRMEQGTLPASGVSDRVLEALGKLVGTSAAALRRAGQAAAEPGGAAPAAGAVFARKARLDDECAQALSARRRPHPRAAQSTTGPTRSTVCSPADRRPSAARARARPPGYRQYPCPLAMTPSASCDTHCAPATPSSRRRSSAPYAATAVLSDRADLELRATRRRRSPTPSPLAQRTYRGLVERLGLNGGRG